MAIVRYAGNRMTGLSSDTKPTESSLITGTTFQETNTDDLYVWTGSAWNIVASNTGTETLANKTLQAPRITLSAVLMEDTTILFEGATDDSNDTTLTVVDPTGNRTVSLPDATGTVSLIAGTETLSNKTYSDHITVAEISAPSTPSSGYGAIYAKSDNKLYFKNDAGTEVDLTNQASGGESNQNAWNTISVSGQDNVVADSATDTVTFVGGTNVTITTNASNDTVTFAASGSGTVTVTDNESTNENNLLTFVADAGTSTGAHGLEMDGDFHYNPSTGRLTATQLAGTLQTAAQTAITSVGALDGGSITSGFGAIDTGSSNITTTGTISAGNLTVTGTTTTVNSSTLTVVDPLIHLQTASGGGNLSSDTNKDVGIVMEYHNGSAAKEAFLGWDDSAGKLTFVPDASISSEVVSGSVGTIVANLEGNATGTAATVTGGTQAAITAAANLVTVGTIGTGVWQGTAIAQAYVADQAINEAKLQVSNNPTNGYVLTAQSGNAGGMTWEASSSSGASESFAIAMAVAL